MKHIKVEKDGKLTIIPESELWPMPDDFPKHLLDTLGDEEDVLEIFKGYFGSASFDGWTLAHARAMVNHGRRQTYEKFKQGRLPLL